MYVLIQDTVVTEVQLARKNKPGLPKSEGAKYQ